MRFNELQAVGLTFVGIQALYLAIQAFKGNTPEWQVGMFWIGNVSVLAVAVVFIVVGTRRARANTD